MGLGLGLVACLACRSEPEPTRTEPSPIASSEPEPEHHLIRFACEGFDAAVAEGAPASRLLSTSAKHAVELGGERVEAATQRWAVSPPQGLLELIDRYEAETSANPDRCAGLRAHLQRMSARASTH